MNCDGLFYFMHYFSTIAEYLEFKKIGLAPALQMAFTEGDVFLNY